MNEVRFLFPSRRRLPRRRRVARTNLFAKLFAGLLGAVLAGAAWGQPPPAPGTPEGWPCIQRYQPAVSAGAFWPHELPEDVNWDEQLQIRNLVDAVTERAVPLEEARGQVRAFLEERRKAAGNSEDLSQDLQKTASLLVAALYELVNSKRDRVIAGISRFSARQQMMISRIEAQASRIEELKAADKPDAKALEDLEARQKWDVRVFDEREDLVSHLCEQPVLMEQKFFAIGRDVAGFLEEHGATGAE